MFERTVWLAVLLFPAVTGDAVAGDSQKPSLPASTTTIGPGLIVFNSNRGGNHEICVMNPDGSGVQALTRDGRYDSWWARVSPDRRHVLFYRNLKSKHKEDYSQTALWVMAADGSGVTELRPVGLDGWAMQGHGYPAWSPDGARIAFHRLVLGKGRGFLPFWIGCAGSKRSTYAPK
jgi:hypothetical protein